MCRCMLCRLCTLPCRKACGRCSHSCARRRYRRSRCGELSRLHNVGGRCVRGAFLRAVVGHANGCTVGTVNSRSFGASLDCQALGASLDRNAIAVANGSALLAAANNGLCSRSRRSHRCRRKRLSRGDTDHIDNGGWDVWPARRDNTSDFAASVGDSVAHDRSDPRTLTADRTAIGSPIVALANTAAYERF